MNNSILNISISCFENCHEIDPIDVNLLAWLTSGKHQIKVEELRSTPDESLRRKIKASLPAITPSGKFNHRSVSGFIRHSGFLTFDIDLKDNIHIKNYKVLKAQISHISSVAYCGLSVSGQGYWGLVHIPESNPEKHKQRFAALIEDFKRFGINIDPSGSDICRLRIYSYDPEPYFNHFAVTYKRIITQNPKPLLRSFHNDNRERVEKALTHITKFQIDITESYKEGWFKVAAALANEFGESGRDYFHTVSKFHPEYDPKKTDRMYDNCLRNNYNRISIATFFKLAKDFNLN